MTMDVTSTQMQTLQKALDNLRGFSFEPAGKMGVREIVQKKFPPGDALKAIKENLSDLEEQILTVNERLNETFSPDNLKTFSEAVTVLKSIRDHYKIYEYTGKQNIFGKFRAWLSQVFHKTLYVQVKKELPEIDIENMKKRVDDVASKVQAKRHQPVGGGTVPPQTKGLTQSQVSVLGNPPAIPKVQSKTQSERPGEPDKVSTEASKQKGSQVETASIVGPGAQFKAVQQVFEGQKSPPLGATESRTGQVGQFEKLKGLLGGVEEFSPQNVVKSDEAQVKREFLEWNGLLKSDQLVCQIWKDEKDGLHMSTMNNAKEVSHFDIDTRSSPGKAKFITMRDGRKVEFVQSKIDLSNLQNIINLTSPGKEAVPNADQKKAEWKGIIAAKKELEKLHDTRNLEVLLNETAKGIPDVSSGAFYVAECSGGKGTITICTGMEAGTPRFEKVEVDLLQNPGEFTVGDRRYKDLKTLMGEKHANLPLQELINRKKYRDRFLEGLNQRARSENVESGEFKKSVRSIFENTSYQKVWVLNGQHNNFTWCGFEKEGDSGAKLTLIPLEVIFDPSEKNAEKQWKLKSKTGDALFSSIDEMARSLGYQADYGTAQKWSVAKHVASTTAGYAAKGAHIAATGVGLAATGVGLAATGVGYAAKGLWQVASQVPGAWRGVSKFMSQFTAKSAEGGVANPQVATAAPSTVKAEETMVQVPEWLNEPIGAFSATVGGTAKAVRDNFERFVDAWKKTGQGSQEEADLFGSAGRFHLIVEGLRSHFSKHITVDRFAALQTLIPGRLTMIEKFQLYELAKTGRGVLTENHQAEVVDFLLEVLQEEKDKAEIDGLKKYFQSNGQRYGTEFPEIQTLLGNK